MTLSEERLFLRRLRDGWSEEQASWAARQVPDRVYRRRDRCRRFYRQYQKAYDAGIRAAHARIEERMKWEEPQT